MKWVNNLQNLVFTTIKETFLHTKPSQIKITIISKKEIFSSYHIVSYIPSIVHCDCLKT